MMADFKPEFFGDDEFKQQERRRKAADELATLYIGGIIVCLIGLVWLWANDWDVRCLFVECRRLLSQ